MKGEQNTKNVPGAALSWQSMRTGRAAASAVTRNTAEHTSLVCYPVFEQVKFSELLILRHAETKTEIRSQGL